MTGLLASKPKAPAPLPPPPDRSEAESAALQQARRARPGAASTLLTSGLGVVEQNGAVRALLGG